MDAVLVVKDIIVIYRKKWNYFDNVIFRVLLSIGISTCYI